VRGRGAGGDGGGDGGGEGSAAADGREHRDLVAVVEDGGVAGDGLVAVDPDACGVEHRGELGAVARAGMGEEVAEQRVAVVELVGGGAGRLARLREQPQPDGQLRSPLRSSRLTFVRAVGMASRRAGSIGLPLTSSMP
jgi:hypothetical protein